MESTAVELSNSIDWNAVLRNSILTGFFTSLFASTFFYALLWWLKPRISISPGIAKFNGNVDGELKPIYAFKIINRTWFYRVLDVKCELMLVETVNTPGGSNEKYRPIDLIRVYDKMHNQFNLDL